MKPVSCEKTAAIITAAGSSLRFGGRKKEYCPFGASTVLASSVFPFTAASGVEIIVVTIPAGEQEAARTALGSLAARVTLAEGGASRQESVYRALLALEEAAPDFVLIHDGARPGLTCSLVTKTLEAAKKYGAALPVLPLTETPKEVDEMGFIKNHLSRKSVFAAQTPQCFAFQPLLASYKGALRAGALRAGALRAGALRAGALRAGALRAYSSLAAFTDDSEIWSRFAPPPFGRVFTVTGEEQNRKITFPGDLP